MTYFDAKNVNIDAKMSEKAPLWILQIFNKVLVNFRTQPKFITYIVSYVYTFTLNLRQRYISQFFRKYAYIITIVTIINSEYDVFKF